MSHWTPEQSRVLVAGVDESGRSTIARDGRVLHAKQQPNGARVEELWRQVELPATVDDYGTPSLDPEPPAPQRAVTVVKFTLPPRAGMEGPGDYAALVSAYGEGNVERPDQPGAILHRAPVMLVMTATNKSAIIATDSGEFEVSAGETIVLPATWHDWRNPHDEAVTFIATLFPMS